MSISFTCRYCNAVLEAPDESVGQRGRCRRCGNVVSAPDPSDAVDSSGKTIPTWCPSCWRQADAPALFAGVQGACRECSHPMRAPAPTDALSKAAHTPPDPSYIPEGAIVNAVDGSILVPIPEGEAVFGSPDGVGRDSEHPTFTASLLGFYIALHPVTYAQYARFGDEATITKRDTDRFEEEFADPALADHPVTDINWDEAGAYCDWAGVRLPFELEWEKAARGCAEGRIFPWGDTWDPALCHNSVEGRQETTRGIWGHPDGRSADGLFQMVGNVDELCEDLYIDDVYARYATGDLTVPRPFENLLPPDRPEHCVSRGWGYGGGVETAFRCAERGLASPDYRGLHGFRVAMDMR